MLALAQGEKIVFSHERDRSADKMVMVVSDLYAPFWFAEVMPELEQMGSDAYQLMRHIGKEPVKWTETVEVVQARSAERVLFELSLDDPAPLFKLQRRTFDADDNPLAVEFLTMSADCYRLGYSFVSTA